MLRRKPSREKLCRAGPLNPPDFELDAIEIPQRAAGAGSGFEGHDAGAPSGAHAAGDGGIELGGEVLIAGRVAVDQQFVHLLFREQRGPVVIGEARGIAGCSGHAAQNAGDGDAHDEGCYQHF